MIKRIVWGVMFSLLANCLGIVHSQETWSNFKFEKIYLYGQVNKPLDPGTDVFRKVFTDLEEDVNNVARKVISNLYSGENDPMPRVTTLYYTVYPDGPLSAKSGSAPSIRISLNAEYVAEAYSEMKSLDKLREELIGVLSHELTHAFQWEPKGVGPYGEDPVCTSFIEGVADANRYQCGDHSWSKPEAGGHYLDGYTRTAFFLLYLKDKYDPNFIKKWNMSAYKLPKWSYDAAIKSILGDEYDVDALWVEYQNSLGGGITGKEDLPVVSEEVHVPAAGQLRSLVNSNKKGTITNLKLTGVISAKDFQFMRDEMRSLTVLDMRGVKIEACPSNALNAQYGYSNKADYIPESAMEGHPYLKTVYLPEGLKGISMMAFKRATNLTGTMTIPASVQEICSVAFEDDRLLKTFVCEGTTPPTLNTDFMYYTPFYGIYPMVMTLKVPKGSLENYLAADGWKDFKVIEEYDTSVTANALLKVSLMSEVAVVGNMICVKSPYTFNMINLYDLSGRLLKTFHYADENEAQLPMESLSANAGFVRVCYSSGGSEGHKVIVHD